MATTTHHDRLLSLVYWFRNRKVSEAVDFCVTRFDGAEKKGEASQSLLEGGIEDKRGNTSSTSSACCSAVTLFNFGI